MHCYPGHSGVWWQSNSAIGNDVLQKKLLQVWPNSLLNLPWFFTLIARSYLLSCWKPHNLSILSMHVHTQKPTHTLFIRNVFSVSFFMWRLFNTHYLASFDLKKHSLTEGKQLTWNNKWTQEAKVGLRIFLISNPQGKLKLCLPIKWYVCQLFRKEPLDRCYIQSHKIIDESISWRVTFEVMILNWILLL